MNDCPCHKCGELYTVGLYSDQEYQGICPTCRGKYIMENYDTTVHLTQAEAREIYDLMSDLLTKEKCQSKKLGNFRLCVHCALTHARSLLRVGGYHPQ